MEYTKKNNSKVLSKIILLVIFIPLVIVVLFIAVPIIMSIACVVFIVMYFTGKKFNRNMFFFRIKNPKFGNNRQANNKKKESNKYYDAEYISIDNEKEK